MSSNPLLKPVLEPEAKPRLRILQALLPLLPASEHAIMAEHVRVALGMHGESATARAVAHVAHGLRLNECLELARDIRDYPGPDDCPHRAEMIKTLCDKLSCALEAYL